MKVVTIEHRKIKDGVPYSLLQQQLSWFRSLGNYAKGCGWKVEQPASVDRAATNWIANGTYAVANFTVTPPVKGWFRLNWVRPVTRKNNYSDTQAKQEIVRTVKLKVLQIDGADATGVTAQDVTNYLRGLTTHNSITIGIDEQKNW